MPKILIVEDEPAIAENIQYALETDGFKTRCLTSGMPVIPYPSRNRVRVKRGSMKLGSRIFFCFLLIFGICFYYPISWVLDNLRTRYLEGVEDPLVDQANILAGLVGSEMQNQQFDP